MANTILHFYFIFLNAFFSVPPYKLQQAEKVCNSMQTLFAEC